MMRCRAVSTRRRRAYSATSATQRLEKDDKKDEQMRKHKKSVQWASALSNQLPDAPLRKCKSEGFLEFDQALKKLSEVSSMLERSATLEKDFEENLNCIQEKLNTGVDLNSAEDS